MTWEGAGTTETSGEYDVDAHPQEPASTSGAGVAWSAGAVFVVIIAAAIAVWMIHLPTGAAQGPTVANAGPPQAVGAGTDAGANAAGVPAGNRAAGSSSPLDRIDHAWAAKAAAATGISDQAFLAYAAADLTIEAKQPACGLGWNTLAAIGTGESANGTYGGTTLLANGYTSKPIIGVPLDGGKLGGGTVAAIPDTDHGKLDGDARWDHAVGPLQFLPSTWAKWGADGNGDGVASPDQIDDAALAAAQYLCASGSMTSVSGWRAAVFSYNESDAYVNEVASIANRYAADVSRLAGG